MATIQIIFFDIDGTLVDHATGCISPKTREALHRLRNKGVRLCICSGRPPATLPDFGDLQFDAFSTFNGSLCYSGDTIIHSSPLAPEDVEKVLANAAALGRPVSVAVRDRLVANGIDRDLSDYYALAGAKLTVAEDFEETCKEDVYQIMLGSRKEEHEAIIRGASGVKLTVAWERAADVIPASGGKGIAITHILAHFGLKPEEAMAFGDGYNDLEMLQTVGTGIAMGNAPDAVKAVADDVCKPVSQDGIYHYCLEKGLI